MSSKRISFVCTILLLLAAGQSAWAQAGTFTVTNTSGSTFTITRTSNTDATEKVLYRTVSLSALAGTHFTEASGTLTFDANNNTRTVTVTENSNVDDAYKYQTDASRQYRFEVTDQAGANLAHYDRTITSGLTQFNGAKVSSIITDLVKFSSGSLSSGMSSDKYVDVIYSTSSNSNHVMNNGYFEVDDEYYYGKQTLCNVSTNSLVSTTNANGSYLNAMGAKIYATVSFTMKEGNDGYQYIQILTDNPTTWDCSSKQDGENAGELKDPSISVYKALFEMDKGNSANASDHKMFFPHKSDNHTSSTEFDYSDAYLYEQKFKSHDPSYRAANSGSLVLDPTVETINVRFDCAGQDNDTYWVKDLKVRMALCDATAPVVLNAPVVAPGHYASGNTVYISVPFSEIVTVSGTPYLHTDWGDFDYFSGSGSNVLTFSGTITATFGTRLITRYISETVSDLAGNAFSNSTNNCYKEYDGLTVTHPWCGSGTPADPYVITTADQLDYLATRVNANYGYDDFSGNYFELGADIAYTATTDWDDFGGSSHENENNYTPVGRYGQPFKGHFDGKGHTISGIRVYVPAGNNENNSHTNESLGLFGFVSGGSVQNVILRDANIRGVKNVGGIVGFNSGTVMNCTLYHVLAGGTYVSNSDIGIVVGNNGADDGNYYRDCQVAMINRDHDHHDNIYEDIDPRNNVYTVATAAGVSATYQSGERVTIDEVTYYTVGSTFTLGYSGSLPGASVIFSSTAGTINGSVLTMPANDVTVSATVTSYSLTLTQGTKDGVTAYWGSFYDGNHRYTLPEGAAAYTMNSEKNLYRVGDDGRVIPKNTAVIIIADKSALTLNVTDNTADIHGTNILLGSDNPVSVAGKAYVLGIVNGVLGFYEYKGGDVPAHKAYYTE